MLIAEEGAQGDTIATGRVDKETATTTGRVEHTPTDDVRAGIVEQVKHVVNYVVAGQEMSFAVAGRAVNVFFIGKADQVAGDILKIVATQEFQRLHKEEIVGIEPVEDGLREEMEVVVTGFPRQDIAIAFVENTHAIKFAEMAFDVLAPIAKAAVAHETWSQDSFVFQHAHQQQAHKEDVGHLLGEYFGPHILLVALPFAPDAISFGNTELLRFLETQIQQGVIDVQRPRQPTFDITCQGRA